MDEEIGYDFNDDHEGEDVLSCIRQAHSTHLSSSGVFSQVEEKNNWRRTTIFHMCTKIGDTNCKLIVDGGSCINAVSSKVIEKVRLKVVPIPTRIRCHGSTP